MNQAVETQATLDRCANVLDACGVVFGRLAPDHWEASTPCPDWSAIELAGHIIDDLYLFRDLPHGAKWPGAPSSTMVLRQRAGADPAADWRRGRAAMESVPMPGLLHRLVATPFGPQSWGEFLAGFAVMELLVHTWDLAQATGVRIELDPLVARFVAAWMEPMDELIGGPVAFGPKVMSPAGSDDVTKLMAFLGRTS
jgi:uncharacterized protein (TIGR03086 family)